MITAASSTLYYGNKMSTFKTIKIGDKEYTALNYTRRNITLPPGIMQKTRESGVLVSDTLIRPFSWYGTTRDEEGQYILLEKTELEDITLINTKYRDKALSLIRKIALGLRSLKMEGLDLISGIFPLYRIYIEKGENIVLLPYDIGRILTLSRSEEETEKSVRNLLSPDKEESYTLTHELIELMYYAASGRFPYEMKEVRLSSFTPYDISLYTDGDKETLSFIMSGLSMSVKNQRAVCRNENVLYPLEWFLSSTQSLNWDFQSLTPGERIYNIKSSEESEKYREEKNKKTRKAGKRTFFREKGTITLVTIILVTILSYLVGNFLYQKYKAPSTKDMTPEEIIAYTIERQNELDAGNINEAFRKEAAQYEDVSTLYVLNKTRMAYEGKEPFISITEWLEEKSEIPTDSFVYGVVIDEIIEISPNEYRASLEWYTPYSMSDKDDENYPIKEGYTRTYLYRIDEYFRFEYNKRGWWECVESSLSNDELRSVIYIPQSGE